MQIEKSLLYQRILIIAFWIRATFGFVSEEFMPFLVSTQPLVYLAFDVVIALLGMITIRKKWDLILLISFIAVSYITTCIYNGLSFMFYLNGLRDFISFLFIIPIINYFFDNCDRKKRFIIAIDKQLYVFLLLQAFCITWQLLRYGGWDHGGGSLGNMYSGIVSTLIYLISFYLIQKRIDNKNLAKSLWKNRIYIILLFPTFLNETKISFILLLIYFLLLVPINKKLFIRILFVFPLIVIFMCGAILIYLSSTKVLMEDVFSVGYLLNDDASEYTQWVFDADNGELEDVPRFTKLLLLEGVDEEYPGHFFTGFGVGTFKGGTFMENSAIFKEYEWLFVGAIPYLFHLIVQLGVIGLIWFVFFWIVKLGVIRVDKFRNLNLQLFIILTILLILFYNDSFRNSFFCFILMFLLEMSWIDKPKVLDKARYLE